jgi:hypothetical protein
LSPPGSTIAQKREENLSAGEAGMWDSLVDLAQVFFPPPYREYGRLPSPTTLLSSLDWAKAGPPGPTGDPARDAELLDNYQRGGWVTKTISVAAPIGAEGLLTSASTAVTKLPALEGMGIGGGRLIGPTEQWLSGFTEIPESLGPELPTLGPVPEGSLVGLSPHAPGVAPGNDLLRPGAPSGGNAANQIKGVIGNEASAYFVQLSDHPGPVLLGKEVPVRVNGVLTYLDNLFITSDGYLIAPEAKFGQYARFTDNQAEIFKAARSTDGWVEAIPDDHPAVEATGLVPGEAVPINIFRMRFSWPLGGL